jgi:hypothetical protein
MAPTPGPSPQGPEGVKVSKHRTDRRPPRGGRPRSKVMVARDGSVMGLRVGFSPSSGVQPEPDPSATAIASHGAAVQRVWSAWVCVRRAKSCLAARSAGVRIVPCRVEHFVARSVAPSRATRIEHLERKARNGSSSPYHFPKVLLGPGTLASGPARHPWPSKQKENARSQRRLLGLTPGR